MGRNEPTPLGVVLLAWSEVQEPSILLLLLSLLLLLLVVGRNEPILHCGMMVDSLIILLLLLLGRNEPRFFCRIESLNRTLSSLLLLKLPPAQCGWWFTLVVVVVVEPSTPTLLNLIAEATAATDGAIGNSKGLAAAVALSLLLWFVPC